MKVNELRIGSLIQLYRKAEDKEMSIHTVCGIDNTPDIGWMIEIEDGFYINIDKGIEPIPITEDWLVKFGFVRLGNQDTWFGRALWSKGKFAVMHGYGTTNGQRTKYDLTEFDYVHQLQNLYFALTGEELIIK